MNKIPGAVKALIIANAVVFGIGLIPNVEKPMFQLFAMFFPKNPSFQYWQVVTSMFLHGGFLHLLLNMYALWAFGSPLEFMWKKNRFLIFYFASGIGASVIYLAVNYFQFNAAYNEVLAMGASAVELQKVLSFESINDPNLLQYLSTDSMFHHEAVNTLRSIFYIPAVGASGAIYGILVAFGMSFPNSKLALIFLPVPVPAKYFIPVLIGIDLFSGVTGFSIFGGGVAHFAHVGGALVGFLLVWYWKSTGKIQAPVLYYQNE